MKRLLQRIQLDIELSINSHGRELYWNGKPVQGSVKRALAYALASLAAVGVVFFTAIGLFVLMMLVGFSTALTAVVAIVLVPCLYLINHLLRKFGRRGFMEIKRCPDTDALMIRLTLGEATAELYLG